MVYGDNLYIDVQVRRNELIQEMINQVEVSMAEPPSSTLYKEYILLDNMCQNFVSTKKRKQIKVSNEDMFIYRLAKNFKV
jgi:hypothetical protein